MTTLLEAPVGTGEFVGYLASYARDYGGDAIQLGAMDQTVADFRTGKQAWLLTDGHSQDTADVVAYVTHAELDGTGLRIVGNWLPGERAQKLREKANAGAPLGLSIDYLVRRERPDGRGGRYLDRIDVVGGAVVRSPMNSMARITESKDGSPASVPVVSWGAAIQVESERRDPERKRLQRMAEVIQAKGWPPPRLVAAIGVKAAYELIEGAALAQSARYLGEDEGDRLARERYEQNNTYSTNLAAWMAVNR